MLQLLVKKDEKLVDNSLLFAKLSLFTFKKRGDFMLCDKICLYPDENAVLELISTFKHLLRKYALLLDYEDAYDDLQLFFIELLYRMSCSDFKSKPDGVIVSYIATSVRNQYIKLAKMRSFKVATFSEIGIGQMSFIEALNSCTIESSIDELFPRDQQLTSWENEVLTSVFVNGKSSSQIARKYKKTRQAVNQAKIRGLNKIKSELQV